MPARLAAILLPFTWLWFAWAGPAASAPGDSPDDVPIEVPADGYVASGTCRACHPREYATWHASFHRTMTQVPTPGSVLGRFDGSQFDIDGKRYRLFREGDAFFAEWRRINQRGKSPQRTVRRRLVLMTGSHHDQMYWYATVGRGRALRQLPLDYSLRLRRWIPAQSTYLAPPGKQPGHPVGEWNRVCSKCHSVDPQMRKDEDGAMDTRVAEFGIACEACHGPAERHVQLNRDPLHRYVRHLSADGDASIVQPAKLDSKRSSEACGQCHGIWMMGDELDGYRPGMDIHARRIFVRSKYLEDDYQPIDDADRSRQLAVVAAVRADPGFFASTFWSDGMVRVSGREYSALLESPCFQRGEISCVSCHDLHRSTSDPRSVEQWRDDQLGPEKTGNAACTSCHPELGGDGLTAHTRHAPGSAGSLCYNCHMPFTVYGIQKAHRSHTVSNPSVDESLATGRPNACNQCHLDRTLAWTANQLEQRHGIAAPPVTGDDADVAAGVLWVLRGDAGQRALGAWSMGWDAARAASGATGPSDWMIPYLAQLLDDPYDSVRAVALMALRKHSGLADFDYDFVGSRTQRRNAVKRARASFVRASASTFDGSNLLLDPSGKIDTDRFEGLLHERDDRPVDIRE